MLRHKQLSIGISLASDCLETARITAGILKQLRYFRLLPLQNEAAAALRIQGFWYDNIAHIDGRRVDLVIVGSCAVMKPNESDDSFYAIQLQAYYPNGAKILFSATVISVNTRRWNAYSFLMKRVEREIAQALYTTVTAEYFPEPDYNYNTALWPFGE